MLKGETQSKLNLSGCTKRIDSGSYSHAIHDVVGARSAVDQPRSSGQHSSQSVARQVKIRKVK
jgi:hypothetical protein